MRKYINLLLVGFLLFVVGIIILNFELVEYNFSNSLPNNFDTTVDTLYLSTQTDKVYRIKAGKYNENLKIKKYINNNLKDKVMIEIKHSDTSDVTSSIKNSIDKTEITFYNQINFSNKSMKDLVGFVLKCITEKKIYNYNLFKYGEISIYGSEDSLSRIEYEDYEV